MQKLRHIAITVPDPEKAAEFYERVFGLKRVGKTDWEGAHGVYLSDGVINVALLHYKQEHYDEAIQAFATILKGAAKTDSQKKIVELAHMALARIYLERGQLTQAQDEYSNDVFPLSATLSSTETLAAITAPVILLPVPDILSPPRAMTAPSNVKLPATVKSPSTSRMP